MTKKKVEHIIALGIFLVVIGIAFFIVFNRAMTKELIHDEHQFISSAYLLAKNGLWPYVDYPYFHMPNLVFVYAILFKWFPEKLLAARVFSVISAVLAAGILYWTIYILARHRFVYKIGLSLCALVLLVADPLYNEVAGFAWNHDLSVLLALLATVIFIVGFRHSKIKKWLFVSGIFLSIAIGVRVSWVMIIPPFLAGFFIFQRDDTFRTKIESIFWFALGGILAMLPSLILFLLAPRKFIFGNYWYAQLNTQYRLDIGTARPIDLMSKLRFFLNYQEPGFWILLVLTIFYVYLWSGWQYYKNKKIDPVIIFAILLLPFIFSGSMLPSPAYRQYFYAVVPFEILAVVYSISFIHTSRKLMPSAWAFRFLVGMTVLSGFWGLDDVYSAFRLEKKQNWVPHQVHEIGMQLADEVGSGRILTLAPTIVAESGLDIYPEFATSPFVWRIGYLLSEEQQILYDVIAKKELEKYLNQTPPAGIILGEERSYENPLIRYAEKNEYLPNTLYDDKFIWLP